MEERECNGASEVVATDIGRVEESAYLLGAPPMREFKEFLQNRVPPELCEPEEALTEEWREAEKYLGGLASTEGGFADGAIVMPLPKEMEGLASRSLQDPSVKKSFALLPHRWALVNADQLIVHQRSVDLTYIRSLKAKFPKRPLAEELFMLASGGLEPTPAVRVTRTAENVWTFACPSADFRFLGFALLNPQSVDGYQPPGRPTDVVSGFVGFGVNWSTALRMQGRLILVNGTNRGYLQYDWGMRYLPCLVREVSSEDELDLIGASDVKQNLQLYLRSRRPPRLKDFFDPKLCKVLPVVPAMRLLHVQITTQRSRVAIG
jgi:hypothetical protein